MEKKIADVFAYYLPQYHEVEENNIWWGKGFTEWTNLSNAKKVFVNQRIFYPHNDLGYYSLDDVNVIQRQYEIAKKYSVTSFCFWHYWFFDDEMLLEKPAELLLNSEIDVEFCFAWANHSWFNKTKGIILKEQRYDFSVSNYFDYLVKFFVDRRYTKINNKPVFVIYDPASCENLNEIIEYFNLKIKDFGYDGIYFIAEKTKSQDEYVHKFDKYLDSTSIWGDKKIYIRIRDKIYSKLARFGLKIPRKYNYTKQVEFLNRNFYLENKRIPIIFPNWDSTIRHKKGGIWLEGSSPYTFKKHVDDVISKNKHSDILFVKSWNEWAEGNFLEPSTEYGYQYLQSFHAAINRTK